MTFNVLLNKQQIADARRILKQRELSFATPEWKQWLLRHGLLSGFRIGDELKSWDVLKTVEFIEAGLDKSARILDIGAYASEILIILHKLGFRNLAGVDLNPRLPKMPHSESIDFKIADFMKTPFANSEFDVVTAISVIEHGYDGQRLFAETARLLKPGGYFVASFDYWPENIPTDGIKMFDMDWRIFSREDVVALLEQAAVFGLRPVGELQFDATERPISCAGKNYTFAWLALQKRTE